MRRTRRWPRPLDDMLAYEHRDVIARFCDNWDVTPEVAREIFDDLKRYLWMCGQRRQRMAPVPIIDEMWHMFLAFTVDYRAFTTRYLGKMYDHFPTSARERAKYARLPPARAYKVFERRLMHEIPSVLATLGEEVMLRWYVRYAVDYDARFFARRRKVPSHIQEYRFSRQLRRRASVSAR